MNILIAIHGSHSQPEQMQAQRDTWLRDLSGADYKFFLGVEDASLDTMPKNGADAVAITLPADDVVLLDMPDGPNWERPGYRSMVGNRKTEALCQYALANDYDFLFKCDDDTYARPDLLLASGFEEHDYSGCTDTHYTRALGWYRWAQGGSGYWLSRRAMGIVVTDGLTLIPAEDFNVGNVLAAHGIHPHHDERHCPAIRAEDTGDSFVSLHKVSAAQMRSLHASLAS